MDTKKEPQPTPKRASAEALRAYWGASKKGSKSTFIPTISAMSAGTGKHTGQLLCAVYKARNP